MHIPPRWTCHRLVAEKEEFMVQWEEDVDALRQQLGSERTRREEDRRELEGAIFDLEDELGELKVLTAVHPLLLSVCPLCTRGIPTAPKECPRA